LSEQPWIQWFPGDFLNGVADLSPVEIGVYVVMLNLIYDHGGPIKLDVARLSRRCRMRPSAFQATLSALAEADKLTIEDGVISNARAQKVLQKRAEKSAKTSEAANARWSQHEVKGEENQSIENADAMQTQCRRNANQKLEPEPEELEAIASVAIGDVASKRDPRFADAWKAYPHVKGRSSQTKAYPCWRKAAKSVGSVRLQIAIVAFASDSRTRRSETGAKGFHLWLRDALYEDWLPKDGPPGDAKPVTVDAKTLAARQAHFTATGEWRPEWGERPTQFLRERTAA